MKQNDENADPVRAALCLVRGNRIGLRHPCDGSGAADEGLKVPHVPVDSAFSGEDILWAVENGGLCDGYSARVVVVSPDLPADMSAADGSVQKDRLLAAIRTRQPQAKVAIGVRRFVK